MFAHQLDSGQLQTQRDQLISLSLNFFFQESRALSLISEEGEEERKEYIDTLIDSKVFKKGKSFF